MNWIIRFQMFLDMLGLRVTSRISRIITKVFGTSTREQAYIALVGSGLAYTGEFVRAVQRPDYLEAFFAGFMVMMCGTWFRGDVKKLADAADVMNDNPNLWLTALVQTLTVRTLYVFLICVNLLFIGTADLDDLGIALLTYSLYVAGFGTPGGKSVFQRAADKLKEAAKNLVLRPAPVPIPN